MAKTESTAVTNLINAVQSQPIVGGLPAPIPPPTRPAGTPAPELLQQAQQLQQRRTSQQVHAPQPASQPAPQPAPQLPRPSQQWAAQTAPPPRPSQQMAAPQVIAKSELVFPPGMQHAQAEEDGWFDNHPHDATEPTDAIEVDLDEFDRPRRSRAPVYIATILAVGAGCALGYYLAFGLPGSKKNPAQQPAAAQPAAPAAVPSAAPSAQPAAPAAAPLAEAVPAEGAPAEEPAAAIDPETAALLEPTAEAAASEPVAEPVAEPAAPAAPSVTRAHFTSDPPGASVTLIDNGSPMQLGATPVDQTLNPDHTYQAVFTLPGRKAVMVPVEPSGAKMTIKGNLAAGTAAVSSEEPAAVAPAPVARKAEPKAAAKKPAAKEIARREPAKKPAAKPAAAAGGTGTLMLNAKPPCDVIVDGRKVGTTPQPNISLSAGSHKVTLINSTHGIKQSFSVTIKPGQKTRVIKDLTDRMK